MILRVSHGKKKTYRKRLYKGDVEKQIIYTEKVFQPEIISINPPKPEETIEEKTVEPTFAVSVPVPKRKKSLRQLFKRAKF